MKQFRLGDTHPLHARLSKVFDSLDREGIKIAVARDGMLIVLDTRDDREYELKDSDDGGLVNHLPPIFEYKLTFEKEG